MKAATLYWLFVASLFLSAVVLATEEEEPASDTQYITPKPDGPVFFLETFNDDGWTKRWFPSTDRRARGDWQVQESETAWTAGDRGLVVASAAQHHAIGALFSQPLDTTGKDLVVQYEVEFQHGIDCGGAYLKLFTAQSALDIKQVGPTTPYTIMFGPDRCGPDDKVHFIIRHENPVSHEIEEKHVNPRPHVKIDKLTHLYTLHVRQDNTYEISIDRQVAQSGSLFTDFVPPINPPTEIDDPSDEKPEDWVDEQTIPDPEARKPDDWDENAPQQINDPSDTKPATWLDNEPSTILDPNAVKPADWNDEEDGEWTAPEIENPKCAEFGCGKWSPRQIRNPQYKGKWTAPNIPNPAYKGEWKARQIPNPNYFEDKHPANFPKMAGIGFELWTMSNGILFDNILITHDKAVADSFADRTWAEKFDRQNQIRADSELETSESIVDKIFKWGNLVYDFAIKNPLIMAGSVVVGLIPIFVCSSLSAPVKKPPSLRQPAHKHKTAESSEETEPPKAESKAAAAAEEKEEEEEIQPDPEPKKTPPKTRKRAPRAD